MRKSTKLGLIAAFIALVLGILFWFSLLQAPCGNFDKGSNEAACVANCKAEKCGFFHQNGEDFCKKLCQENYYHSGD